MEFSTDEIRSRIVQKIELADQIAANQEEFVEFLMTIQDEEAIEEFFNGCHGRTNGRFCGGKAAAKAAIGGYINEKSTITKETLQGRKLSENVKHVTVGIGRNVGSVRLARLKKADLKTFSDNDLKVVKNQLKVDQKHFKVVQAIGFVTATYNIATGLEPGLFKVAKLANSATMIGVATYKNNRIPEHLARVNKELKSRGVSLSLSDTITFASELSVKQEIDKAKKAIESGKVSKATKPTAAQVEALGVYLDSLAPDPEEGITKIMIADMKSGLADYKKSIK